LAVSLREDLQSFSRRVTDASGISERAPTKEAVEAVLKDMQALLVRIEDVS
jgi:hypothetical protein